MQDFNNIGCPPVNMTCFKFRLRRYRLDALSKKKNKNGYKTGIIKGTPDYLVKQFAAFDRKIKKLPLFNDNVKADYLNGIQLIYSSYYESIADLNYRKKKHTRDGFDKKHRTYYFKDGYPLPGFGTIYDYMT
jgi:hypothetical protein